jgi:RHS repeat-associated protein
MGHQGLMHDSETGLIYNRARMLHPGLGRFVQRDPLGYVDGSSVYEYVRSGPLGNLDPKGTDVPIQDCQQECDWVYAKLIKQGVNEGVAVIWLHNSYKCCTMAEDNSDCWKKINLKPPQPIGPKPKPTPKNTCPVP